MSQHHASLDSPVTEKQLLRSACFNALWFVIAGAFFVTAIPEFKSRTSVVYGLAYLAIVGLALYNGYTGLRDVIHTFMRNQAPR